MKSGVNPDELITFEEILEDVHPAVRARIINTANDFRNEWAEIEERCMVRKPEVINYRTAPRVKQTNASEIVGAKSTIKF